MDEGARHRMDGQQSRRAMLLGFFHRYGAFVESLLASTLRLVNAVECAAQFAQEIRKWLIERGGPSHNDIVEAIAGVAGCDLA